jgi:hypothetical protein
VANILDGDALERWQRDPARFITEVLINPETGAPFVLLPAEVTFLQHAYRTGDDGRLFFPEQVYSCPKKSGKTGFAAMHALTTALVYGVYSCPKKSGKTGFAAMHALTTALVYGGPDAEVYCIDNYSSPAAPALSCVLIVSLQTPSRLIEPFHWIVHASKIVEPLIAFSSR